MGSVVVQAEVFVRYACYLTAVKSLEEVGVSRMGEGQGKRNVLQIVLDLRRAERRFHRCLLEGLDTL